jgi:hypothetical protein
MDKESTFSRIGTFTLTAAAMSMLAACGKPGESDVQTQLAKGVADYGEVESCKKIDGLEREVFGVKGYEIKFECQVAVKKECCWAGSMRCHGAESETLGADGMIHSGCGSGDQDHKPGERFTVSGSMSFVKTDNGWTAR